MLTFSLISFSPSFLSNMTMTMVQTSMSPGSILDYDSHQMSSTILNPLEAGQMMGNVGIDGTTDCGMMMMEQYTSIDNNRHHHNHNHLHHHQLHNVHDLQALNAQTNSEEHSFTSRSSTQSDSNNTIPSPLIRMDSVNVSSSGLAHHHHHVQHSMNLIPGGQNRDTSSYLFQSSSIDGSSASPVSSTSSCTIPDVHGSNQNQIMYQNQQPINPLYGTIGRNPHPISSAYVQQQKMNPVHHQQHNQIYHPLSIDTTLTTSLQSNQSSSVLHHSMAGGGSTALHGSCQGKKSSKNSVSFQESPSNISTPSSNSSLYFASSKNQSSQH